MADDVFVEMVADELTKAADLGETRSRAQLQGVVGIGSGDLDAVLDELRARGRAAEEAPDEWTVPESEASEASPAPEREEGFAPGGLPEPASDLPGRPRQEEAWTPRHEGAEDRRVELTMAVAQALDEATLGKLVKAGVDDAQAAGVSFEFVVLA